MARAIWKGDLSFGLVTIPVSLFSAEKRDELRFRQLDRRDLSLVREKRVNEKTGAEVPWDDVVKGYEYEEGRFVVLEARELEDANPVASHTIDIIQAVSREAVPSTYFERPYFVVPTKSGRKAYHLLRETLARTNRIAIATVVLRARQHLSALMPEGNLLVLDLLRYSHELRRPEELGIDEAAFQPEPVRDKEIELAEQLVAGIESPWHPDEYRDEYRDDVLALIERKAKTGKTAAVEAPRRKSEGAEVVDMMELLKRSVDETRKGGGKPRRRAKTA